MCFLLIQKIRSRAVGIFEIRLWNYAKWNFEPNIGITPFLIGLICSKSIHIMLKTYRKGFSPDASLDEHGAGGQGRLANAGQELACIHVNASAFAIRPYHLH